MKTLLIMFAFFALLFLFSWVCVQIQRRRLIKQRKGETICQFARSFDFRNVDTRIIRTTYEYLADWNKVKGKPFPVRASDSLDEIYKIAEEDVDELAEKVAKRTGRSLKEAERNPLYGKVMTVGDIVLFINSQPRNPV